MKWIRSNVEAYMEGPQGRCFSGGLRRGRKGGGGEITGSPSLRWLRVYTSASSSLSPSSSHGAIPLARRYESASYKPFWPANPAFLLVRWRWWSTHRDPFPPALRAAVRSSPYSDTSVCSGLSGPSGFPGLDQPGMGCRWTAYRRITVGSRVTRRIRQEQAVLRRDRQTRPTTTPLYLTADSDHNHPQ